MLITDKNLLKKYYSENRLWQGIPGIEVTKNGRIFATFYSGGTKEEIENYAVLLKSDDGINFGEPIAAAFDKNHRCYDPCLWIDPLGRLWFTWSYAPDNAVYACICDEPDADELKWSEEKIIGYDVMMNKPTVLSTGEWIFPIAAWGEGIRACDKKYDSKTPDKKAFAYKTTDNGKTLCKMGGTAISNRSFDEHIILELNDGRLAMYIRTTYGIGVSYSFDRGKTWTEGKDSGLGGPCSRFFIRRLKSGRILLINHYKSEGKRTNLAAMLSEDEGQTWKYRLMLDERENISYPDAVEHDDGYIYIIYDRERGAFVPRSLKEVYECAREILISKITEEDIIAGSLVSKESKLQSIVSKLGKYAKENENPYHEPDRYSDKELAKHLLTEDVDVISTLFEYYRINCINMSKLDNNKLDSLVEKLNKEKTDKEKTVLEIISLIRSVSDFAEETAPVTDRIKNVLNTCINDDISVKEIADKIGISQSYMCYLFKKTTGLTVTDYKNELKITKAKDLLINSDEKITDIAHLCGFGSSSYFSEVFIRSEGVSPSEYRKLNCNR